MSLEVRRSGSIAFPGRGVDKALERQAKRLLNSFSPFSNELSFARRRAVQPVVLRFGVGRQRRATGHAVGVGATGPLGVGREDVGRGERGATEGGDVLRSFVGAGRERGRGEGGGGSIKGHG